MTYLVVLFHILSFSVSAFAAYNDPKPSVQVLSSVLKHKKAVKCLMEVITSVRLALSRH